jgi:hypothetical protein
LKISTRQRLYYSACPAPGVAEAQRALQVACSCFSHTYPLLLSSRHFSAIFMCHDTDLLVNLHTELFGFFRTLSIVWCVEVLQKTTTFRRLDLSPSSGGWGRIDLLSWARQKELVSITGSVKLPHTRRWIESKRSQIVLYNIHHRQNPLKLFATK